MCNAWAKEKAAKKGGGIPILAKNGVVLTPISVLKCYFFLDAVFAFHTFFLWKRDDFTPRKPSFILFKWTLLYR